MSSLSHRRPTTRSLQIDNRYYFGSGAIYDVGTLPFVDIGYYPSGSLVGNNGRVFHSGLFASGYVTQDLPTPFRSYLYGGLQLTAESGANPRLLDTDVGLAVRPFSDHQGLELRLGYNRTDDVQAHVTRELVYGAMRIAFGIGSPDASPLGASPNDWSSSSIRWPQI
jgi:hypothetical protein